MGSKLMYSAILNAIGNFTENDLMLFGSQVRLRQLQKGEIILQKGAVLRSVFYLIKGSVYQYSLRSEADQNIVDLHAEGEWFLNQRSLISQLPSEVFITAYT